MSVKSRRISELQHNISRLADRLDETRKELEAAVNQAGRLAREVEVRDDQLAAMRRELAGQERLIRAQQAQLDELLGLRDPRVADGRRWQENRPDKRHEKDGPEVAS